MSQETTPAVKPTLEEVRNQFETWRKSRQRRTPIPDLLWHAAVSLSRDYSVLQISKALRLNYTDLKKRVHTSRSVCLPETNSRPAFVELDFSKSIFPAECIVEMEDKSGARIKMYFKGEAGLDLLELGKAFWSKAS